MRHEESTAEGEEEAWREWLGEGEGVLGTPEAAVTEKMPKRSN